jgi:pyruvate kinase
MRELALSFGVHPSYLEAKKNKMKIQKAAVQELVNEGTVNMDDLVIYIGGRFGEDAGASFIEISTADRLFTKSKEIN